MGTSAGLGTTTAENAATETLGPNLNKSDSEPQISDHEAAEWAALLMGQITGPSRPAQLGLSDLKQSSSSVQSGSHGPQAGINQGNTGAMTQSQSADTSGVNEAGPNRLILNVDSETLGRVQLVVDRDEGGVRVLVGGDASARSRLSKGKHTLNDALSAAGVRVHSLRIVSSNEVGTVLAQDLMSKKSRPETERREAGNKQRDKSQRSKRSTLNLIG